MATALFQRLFNYSQIITPYTGTGIYPTHRRRRMEFAVRYGSTFLATVSFSHIAPSKGRSTRLAVSGYPNGETISSLCVCKYSNTTNRLATSATTLGAAT